MSKREGKKARNVPEGRRTKGRMGRGDERMIVSVLSFLTCTCMSASPRSEYHKHAAWRGSKAKNEGRERGSNKERQDGEGRRKSDCLWPPYPDLHVCISQVRVS